jgi:hypothetical protein
MRIHAAILTVLMTSALFVSAAEVPDKKVADFLGADVVDILKTATKVEVFRIQGVAKGNDESIGGYRVIGAGKDQDKDFVAAIRALAFDEKTYSFESAKLCIFDPGVAFKLVSGEKSCVLLLCFHCSELEFKLSPKGDKATPHEDFDNKYAEFLKLAKASLPNDKDIQALK